jgi:hypothetical protein
MCDDALQTVCAVRGASDSCWRTFDVPSGTPSENGAGNEALAMRVHRPLNFGPLDDASTRHVPAMATSGSEQQGSAHDSRRTLLL